MHPMYLPEVERKPAGGTYGPRIEAMRAAGLPVPQIWHLFAYKPDRTDFLAQFTQGVMRGPSSRLTQDDVERVTQAGCSEEAIYDAITVCALFNFYNKWIDATGVSDMPAAAYAASGVLMAEHGYAATSQQPVP